MKVQLAYCNLPPLHPVILGDNQFFGVNHMSQERAMASAQRFDDDEAVLALMKEAYGLGVRAMMLHSHPRAESICAALRAEPAAWKDFELYPCIPYAMKYVAASNETGLAQVLTDQVKKAGVASSLLMLIQGSLGAAAGDYFKLIGLLVDLEMLPFRGVPTRAIVLHNVVVDLILGLKIKGLLRFYADHVNEKYGVRAGFGSLNLPLLAEALAAEGVKDAVIMTAVNKKGFFMNPSQAACGAVLQDEKLLVIAMSILASGAIPPEEAFSYAASFPAVKSFLFGASSRDLLEQNLKKLGELRIPPTIP